MKEYTINMRKDGSAVIAKVVQRRSRKIIKIT